MRRWSLTTKEGGSRRARDVHGRGAGSAAAGEVINGVELGRGMEAEVEMTLADDGVTYDLLVKLETRVMADSGKPIRLNIAFEYLSTLGGQCLVEAGTFPGNPPRRLFYRCELLPGTGDAYTPPVLAEAVARWTGRAPARDDRGPRVLWDASVLRLAILDKLYGPLPSPSPESRDPFAGGHEADRRGGELAATPMPEWFGAEGEVWDWSGRLEAAYQLPAGSTRFWITGYTAFLDGWDPASAGLKLPGNPLESEAAQSMSLLETVLRHRPAIGAEGRIVSRTLLPLHLQSWPGASVGAILSGPPTEEMPEEFRDWADFSVELRKEEQEVPGAATGTTRSEVSEPLTGVVNLALSPPLVPARLELRAEVPVDSAERPEPPARTSAALADGGELEMESRMVRLSSGAPPYPGSPVELWWRRRVSERPLPAAAGK